LVRPDPVRARHFLVTQQGLASPALPSLRETAPAMSLQNVEIVRRLCRAMDARDEGAVSELAHPDVEWIPDSRVGEGPIRGRENVIRFFTDRAEMFDELHAEPERFSGEDERVFLFLCVSGRGQASGGPFEIRMGHLWTVRGGVVVRGEGYGDRSEALGAAGLSEQDAHADS
jgi:uncharacterized protein